MSHRIDILVKPRLNILTTVDEFTIDQLNTIPAGFRNNIMWNLGHMVAAQSGIWYKRAGLPLPANISEEFFETYKPGTIPERTYTAEDLQQIKDLFVSSLEAIEAEIESGKFSNYPTWTTRYGADIGSIDEAVAFLPFHDGFHIGTILALRKLV